MKIRPISDWIIASRIEQERKTSSGLITLEVPEGTPNLALVEEVGPGRHTETGEVIPMPVRVGDTVAYSAYQVPKLDLGDGKDLIILSPANILGVVEE